MDRIKLIDINEVTDKKACCHTCTNNAKKVLIIKDTQYFMCNVCKMMLENILSKY